MWRPAPRSLELQTARFLKALLGCHHLREVEIRMGFSALQRGPLPGMEFVILDKIEVDIWINQQNSKIYFTDVVEYVIYKEH